MRDVTEMSLADESVLLDMKHLLLEAKQKVPPFLLALQSENEKYLELGGECKEMCGASSSQKLDQTKSIVVKNLIQQFSQVEELIYFVAA